MLKVKIELYNKIKPNFKFQSISISKIKINFKSKIDIIFSKLNYILKKNQNVFIFKTGFDFDF